MVGSGMDAWSVVLDGRVKAQRRKGKKEEKKRMGRGLSWRLALSLRLGGFARPMRSAMDTWESKLWQVVGQVVNDAFDSVLDQGFAKVDEQAKSTIG